MLNSSTPIPTSSAQVPFQLVQRQLRMSHGLELHGGISAQHAQQNVGTAGMLPQVSGRSTGEWWLDVNHGW